MTDNLSLKRSIPLPLLILYGLGTMVGGGFYALLGKVAGEAGLLAPIALMFSGLLAFLSATSFAELSSRFPVSAGEVQYVREGFNSKIFATIIGWLVILTGVVSAATLAVATIGFLQDFVQVPTALGILLLVLGMALVAGWGIGQSVALVVTITFIEVAALIYIVALTGNSFGQLPERWQELFWPANVQAWIGVFSGAFLAFYAFIGFEDMVNMAEEVKKPRRALPIAILISVVLTTLIYMVVSIVAVLSVSPSVLAASRTPMAEIVSGHGWYSVTGLWFVSMLTGLNGALVQIIMAARVAYGMAKKEQAPAWFARINPVTRTPLYATAVITGIILLLALFLPLTTLAKATSSIILVIFASVNLAAWKVKRKKAEMEDNVFVIPNWLPLLGFFSCVLVLLFQGWLTVAAW